MAERYLIVSSDCHAGLQCAEYRPYLESRHHAAFDEFLADCIARREEALKFNYDYITHWEGDNEEGLRGAFDPQQRDKELDADGVAGEVIFADSDSVTGMESPPFGAGLSAGSISDPELAYAGAIAHNRWLAEFCSHSPVRRAGIALVPISQGVERAVAEIERLAGTAGIRGIMVPTMWHDHKPYNHRAYDPVWAACAANGLVVHTHSGEAPREEYGDDIGPYLAEVSWWAARPISFLLLTGVFDRYPDLRFVVTEAGAYWANDLMWKWDIAFSRTSPALKKLEAVMGRPLSKRPSEYFGTNVFIGASTMSLEEIRRRHVIGCDVMMWGTDYPHPEGTWPHTTERLKQTFHDVSIEDTAKLVGLTAIRCYGMDEKALRAIANKIGPRPSDLAQDPDLRTNPDEVAAARWWLAEDGA
jgi:predicted TIM-barrel fold metal-dependent hydrolase